MFDFSHGQEGWDRDTKTFDVVYHSEENDFMINFFKTAKRSGWARLNPRETAFCRQRFRILQHRATPRHTPQMHVCFNRECMAEESDEESDDNNCVIDDHGDQTNFADRVCLCYVFVFYMSMF